MISIHKDESFDGQTESNKIEIPVQCTQCFPWDLCYSFPNILHHEKCSVQCLVVMFEQDSLYFAPTFC